MHNMCMHMHMYAHAHICLMQARAAQLNALTEKRSELLREVAAAQSIAHAEAEQVLPSYHPPYHPPAPGCSPMHSRLQPCAPERATL